MPASRYSSAHFLPIATSASHWQARGLDDGHKSSRFRNDRRKHRTKTSPISSNPSSGQPASNTSQVTIRDFAASESPHQLHAQELNVDHQSDSNMHGPVDQQLIHASTEVIDTVNQFPATMQEERQIIVPPQTRLTIGASFPSEDVTPARTTDSKTTTPISIFSTPPIYQDTPPATTSSPPPKSNSYITSKRQSIIQDLEFQEESIIIRQTPDVEIRSNVLRLSDDTTQSNTVNASEPNDADASIQSLYHTFVKESSEGDHAGANPLRIILPDLEDALLVAKTEEDTGVDPNGIEHTSSQINFRQNTINQEEEEDTSQGEDRPRGSHSITDTSLRHPDPQAFSITNRTFRGRCSRPRHRIQISSDADVEDNNEDISPRHSSDYDTPTLTAGVRSLSLLSTATTHVTSPSPPPTIPSRGSSLKGIRIHSAQRTNSTSVASSTRASNSSIQQRSVRQSLLSTSSSHGSASFTNSSQRRSYETTMTELDHSEARACPSPNIGRESTTNTQSTLASTPATQSKETKHYHTHRNTNTYNRNRNHSSTGSRYSFYYNTTRNHPSHQAPAARPHQRSISASTVNYSRPSTAPGQAPALVPDLAFSPAPTTIRHGRNHSSETRMETVDDGYTFDREPAHQDPPSPYFGLDFDFGVDFNLNESSYTYDIPRSNPQQHQQTRSHSQHNQASELRPQPQSPNTPIRPETSSDLDATPPPIPITRSKPITRILNPAPWLLDSASDTSGRFGSEAKVWSETRHGNSGTAHRSGLGIGVGMGAMKSGWRRVLGQVY